ncbi:glycosyltransferase, partial [Streptomyces sp. NPDC005568]|uniref:glycosyltransferase n=1 Tax=Streptomyces sp. NPDC005568 TaxID=3156887 RepID=UPI0033AF4486
RTRASRWRLRTTGTCCTAPRAEPRVVAAADHDRSGIPSTAAEDFVERLPGGSCSLDLGGRFVYLSSGASDLLGCPANRLLGTLPWQSLRWLDDPAYEDRYRAAVLSREPIVFTACRPPDRWLDFHLYPDASGISVRIVPTGTPSPPLPGTARSASSVAPTRAGRLYQLTHLAAALTEVVGVQDVIDLVADQIMPAFGAQGLVLSAADAGDDLARIFASLDAFVHTGPFETFCQTVQEAMASAVPVVAPAAGGPLDLVAHGRTGLLVPPRDPAAVRDAVWSLAADPALRAAYGAAGRDAVKTRTWAAVGDQLIGHYTDVLSTRTAVAA